jgi:imidazolonepropionase-like amidohydrolase
MQKRLALTCLASCLLFSPLAATAQAVVLRSKGVLDVEAGKMIEPGIVVIEGNHIRAINPAQLPAGAQTIDLGDLTLVPGLIDMHTHLTDDIEGDWTNRAVKETAADFALRGARNAKRTLEAGFTTVRDLGAAGFSDIALMNAIDKDFVEGPRMFPAAHAVSITGGHCDVTGFAPGVAEVGPEAGVADGREAILRAVRYQIKHGAKVIKICATAGVLSFEGPVGAQQLSEDEMRAAVEEATRHGLKVAAHAHGTDGIIAAVKAGVASIEHGSMLNDEAIQLMKQRGTYLVPTAYVGKGIDMNALPAPIRAKAEYVLPLARESLRKAILAGVKIAFGTDAAVFPHGLNAREFAVYVERGMSPADAIRTATVNATDLLGVKDRGRIAPGMLADIIAVAGNPLDNVRVLEDVRFVMKDGKVYKKPEPIVQVRRSAT